MPYYRVILPALITTRVEEIHVIEAESEKEALEKALVGDPAEVVEDNYYYEPQRSSAGIEELPSGPEVYSVAIDNISVGTLTGWPSGVVAPDETVKVRMMLDLNLLRGMCLIDDVGYSVGLLGTEVTILSLTRVLGRASIADVGTDFVQHQDHPVFEGMEEIYEILLLEGAVLRVLPPKTKPSKSGPKPKRTMVVRQFQDAYNAWLIADVATQLGWRVASVSFGPLGHGHEKEGSHWWHVFIEMPREGREIFELDDEFRWREEADGA